MIDCVIVGDSIGVGLYQYNPSCYSYSVGGYNSAQWNTRYPNALKDFKDVDTVIISLGSNDHRNVNTKEELIKLRSKVVAKRVFWILPYGNVKSPVNLPIENVQRQVEEVAKQYNDIIIPIKYVQGDKIHPTMRGYKQIMEDVNERKN